MEHAGATTAEADIGKVVARAVNDPRTANKTLVIRVNALTQNQIIAAYESVSGEKVGRRHVTAEELEHEIQGAGRCHGMHCCGSV